MEKRSSERVAISADAKIISAGKAYDGSIENVSEAGMEYLMTSVVETQKDFVPDKIIEVNFQVPSGEILKLQCQVKWYMETDPHDRKVMLGMKILNPPGSYKGWIRDLKQ